MSLIEQLADIVGFHSSYTGAFGDRVHAKDQAKRALLKAMGFELDDDSLTTSIEYLKQSQWLNILPVVHIAKLEDQQHAIKVSLPKIGKLLLNWKVTPEVGSEIGNEVVGSINVDNMQVIAETKIGKTQYCQYLLILPTFEQGYYQLTISFGDDQASCPLLYAPKTCYSAQEASVNKVWGYTAQLYSLRSKKNWGMGDFTDLYNLVEKSAQHQASTIGLNPLHPLYQQNPAHRSPYSPSSRCFLNPLYIDVSKIPNFERCELAQTKVKSKAFQQNVADAKASNLIDYPAVAKLKFEITELLFEDFYHQDTRANKTDCYKKMSVEFEHFKKTNGHDLQRFATFDTLYEYFNLADENTYGWPDWPTNFQDPDSEEVHKFQLSHATRIEYFCFLQWIAHKQLSAVTQYTIDKDMAIGLYLDLAVGCDGSGFDVWSDKEVYVAGASIGAPPDGMNPLGQNWGLTPINPVALQKQGYQPLVKALRSSMQYAGALRIDHILGLMRQYWVAPGMAANEGVYINFPWDDILRVIALESRRNKCVVIGEDLGNVPEGFSETIQNAGLLSFKVLFFERWQSGLFKRPENFPTQSVITVATHDTATLAGWWQGRDLQWRQQLNLYPNDEAGDADRHARASERENLLAALADLQVIDMSQAPQLEPAMMNTELSTAVQKYLATSPSHIQLIPLEDALEVPEQVNIPGTIDQHPNWLQKLPVALEDFSQTSSVKKIAQAMNIARPK
ncbi:4-alpha-glucanotransferase [Colwellia sp. C1TZA3]|uniref:4-alpha-glucanotransferase n=1 Tax=Colwellia sp. C1TZA3 TaxID=2508879 RepID=UPI0011B9569A|nr:4-alpha-glucanotransferase [Colwellia sp. C1TZA3]TWX72461.1 4-alpha-glucanotransferase [Colwellia sp. C1TZA3]